VPQVYPDHPARDRQWTDLVDGLLHVADVGPGHLDDAVERHGTSEDGVTGPGLLDGPTSTVYLLAFDTTREPFDDPVVRRAASKMTAMSPRLSTISRLVSGVTNCMRRTMKGWLISR
jgi:hypothetical protein